MANKVTMTKEEERNARELTELLEEKIRNPVERAKIIELVSQELSKTRASENCKRAV